MVSPEKQIDTSRSLPLLFFRSSGGFPFGKPKRNRHIKVLSTVVLRLLDRLTKINIRNTLAYPDAYVQTQRQQTVSSKDPSLLFCRHFGGFLEAQMSTSYGSCCCSSFVVPATFSKPIYTHLKISPTTISPGLSSELCSDIILSTSSY